MKIVHILPALTKGGGERVAVELANAAQKSGNLISIIAGYKTDSELLQKNIAEGIQILFIAQSASNRYLSLIPWIIKNKKWLSETDIIHCHLTYGSVFGTVLQILFSSSAKKPTVIETYHAVGMRIPKFNRWIHSILATKRDGVVFMARDSFWDQFIKQHPKLLTRIIPNGISINKHNIYDKLSKEQYKNEIGIPSNCQLIIGTVGMLRPDRQPEKYISIFKDVIGKVNTEVHFIIAGGGVLLEQIRKEVKQKGLDNRIHLPGLVMDPGLAFSVMDIYISLNVGSITGISVLEACLAKLPVIAIQLLDDYEPSEKDWIWSNKNESKISDKLVELIYSPGSREKIASAQYKFVSENLSTEVMADSYNKFYQEVLARKLRTM
jgi:glycosyltransferase involved in cell wall biosynthesis